MYPERSASLSGAGFLDGEPAILTPPWDRSDIQQQSCTFELCCLICSTVPSLCTAFRNALTRVSWLDLTVQLWLCWWNWSCLLVDYQDSLTSLLWFNIRCRRAQLALYSHTEISKDGSVICSTSVRLQHKSLVGTVQVSGFETGSSAGRKLVQQYCRWVLCDLAGRGCLPGVLGCWGAKLLLTSEMLARGEFPRPFFFQA